MSAFEAIFLHRSGFGNSLSLMTKAVIVVGLGSDVLKWPAG